MRRRILQTTTSVRPHNWMSWKQRFHASLVEADDWCWCLRRRRVTFNPIDPENEERGEAADCVPHHEVSEFRNRNRFAELSEDSDEESVESATEDTGVVVPLVGSRVMGQAVAVPVSGNSAGWRRWPVLARSWDLGPQSADHKVPLSGRPTNAAFCNHCQLCAGRNNSVGWARCRITF